MQQMQAELSGLLQHLCNLALKAITVQPHLFITALGTARLAQVC